MQRLGLCGMRRTPQVPGVRFAHPGGPRALTGQWGRGGDEARAVPALARELGRVALGVDLEMLLPVAVAVRSPRLPGDTAAPAATSRRG